MRILSSRVSLHNQADQRPPEGDALVSAHKRIVAARRRSRVSAPQSLRYSQGIY